MGLNRVGTPHDDEVRIQYIFERVGGCTGTERERETGNGRAVADASAVVNVVGLEGDTGPFLQGVAVLIHCTALGVETQRPGAALFVSLCELLRDQVNSFVPRSFLKLVALLDQGFCQPAGLLDCFPAGRPFRAELAFVDRGPLVRFDTNERVPIGHEVKAAANPAVGTGRCCILKRILT